MRIRVTKPVDCNHVAAQHVPHVGIGAVRVQTVVLIGPALDWAVATAEGVNLDHEATAAAYSGDWAQGGPIIEREKIDLEYDSIVQDWRAIHPKHFGGPPYASAHGATALVAAMRAYVRSKMGDVVDVPEGVA
ncbi:MAG: DUF2591 family protein [Burkholderiaceae bacterium]|nr:DUF2591 family protein [Burkholderiaceae bacterium]